VAIHVRLVCTGHRLRVGGADALDLMPRQDDDGGWSNPRARAFFDPLEM
jgi:hypothetical protein